MAWIYMFFASHDINFITRLYKAHILKHHRVFVVTGGRVKQITTDISTNRLYACLSGDNKIDIFSLDGHFQQHRKQRQRRSRPIKRSYICAIDVAGTVLIADCDNSHLQLLSSNGQWSFLQLQAPVEMPRSAWIMNDVPMNSVKIRFILTKWSNKETTHWRGKLKHWRGKLKLKRS